MANRVLDTQRAVSGNRILDAQVEGATVQVSSDLLGFYSVLGQVSADLVGAYPVFTAISADLVGAYVVTGRVSADLNGAYLIGSGIVFVRAPAGSGYSPRRLEMQQRPAAFQRTIR